MERSMNIEEKRALLQGLNTKQLIDDIKKAEVELEAALRDQTKIRLEKPQFIKSPRAGICEAVNILEAQLAGQAPAEINGKKTTQADRDSWLTRQRTENKELADAYAQQKMADVVMADLDIKQKMAEVKLSDLKAILSLRSAQINLLAGDIRIIVNETEDQIKEEAKN